MVKTEKNRSHRGQCHCQKVSFEFKAPSKVKVLDCNCSICDLIGFRHLIIPRRDFNLLSGKEFLTLYQFNTRVAEHLFCSSCGVKSFYVPRSNPNGISINFRCVDQSGFAEVEFDTFDGQNWEANADSLKHL